ncbi:PKD domain-containing protein, partial [candidate division KSB1 bacterium]
EIDIVGDTGNYSYTWNTVPPQNTSLISNLSAGTYIVTISDGSCIYVDTIDVINYPEPVISFTEIIDEICGHADGSATVHVSGGTPPITYTWNTVPPQIDSIAVSLAAGTYSVTVSDSFCTVSDQVSITNYPGPNAAFTFTPKTAQMPFPKFTFEDISTGMPVAWSWDFGDSTGYSNVQNPVYTYTSLGSYTVILEVSDINGCIDTVSHILNVKDVSLIFIPNTFTPSNRDGLNDDFMPLGHNMDFDHEFEMSIYDRWGRLVYYTDKYIPWNGRLNNNGEILKEGVYMYKVFVRELGGLLKTYSGNITLL